MNPDQLADLEEQRGFLTRSLDDLERERAAGDVDDLDAATLREEYTRRLERVQRAIDTGEAIIAERRSVRRPWWQTAVGVLLVVALAVGAAAFAMTAFGSRKPGESATGSIRDSSANDLSRAAALAQQGKFAEALQLYDGVIKRDPKNVEALEERGLLTASLASPANRPDFLDVGESFVRRALAVTPNDARGLFYLGLVLRLKNDTTGAKAALDAALAADPPDALRTQIEQFRSSIGT